MTFIPFYYINYLRGEAIYAGKLVFIFLATGAVGTLLGGPLADLWGVPFALKTIALMPVIGLLIAWFIPYPPESAWESITPRSCICTGNTVVPEFNVREKWSAFEGEQASS